MSNKFSFDKISIINLVIHLYKVKHFLFIIRSSNCKLNNNNNNFDN